MILYEKLYLNNFQVEVFWVVTSCDSSPQCKPQI